jgi:hypothetical protein
MTIITITSRLVGQTFAAWIRVLAAIGNVRVTAAPVALSHGRVVGMVETV